MRRRGQYSIALVFAATLLTSGCSQGRNDLTAWQDMGCRTFQGLIMRNAELEARIDDIDPEEEVIRELADKRFRLLRDQIHIFLLQRQVMLNREALELRNRICADGPEEANPSTDAAAWAGESDELVRDPGEFARRCEEAVDFITTVQKPPPGGTDSSAASIARHLGASDEGIREKAIWGLGRIILSNRPAPASACIEYLDKKHPPEVRAIALASALWTSADEVVKETFVELACGKVTPPHMDLIGLSAHGSWTDGKTSLASLIPEGKHKLVARRLLEAISQCEPSHRYRLMRQVLAFDKDVVGPEIGSWFATEPNPEARRALFDHRVVEWWKKWPSIRDDLVALGMADWDPEVLKRAKDVHP